MGFSKFLLVEIGSLTGYHRSSMSPARGGGLLDVVISSQVTSVKQDELEEE